MIHIKVELWPGGDKARAQVIGEATIEPVGGTLERGDYEAALLKWKPDKTAHENPVKAPVWKRVMVSGHKRLTHGPWDLLFRVLSVAVGGARNKGVETWSESSAPVDARETGL
jgi:hypothetical protein